MNEIQHVQLSATEEAEEQAKDEVWSEVIKWVKAVQIAEKSENRGKSMEVLVARSMFKIRDGILMFTRVTNWSRVAETWPICLPNFLKGFFVLSA